jgi:hypothetical protein
MQYNDNNCLKNILFISSLVHPATSISILRALLSLNSHNVKIISDVENIEFPQIKIRKGFFDIIEEIDTETNLVLFIEGGSFQLFPFNIHKIQAITAFYGIDTHTNFKKHVAISKLFDLTFIAQKEYVNQLCEITYKPVFWLPLAFDDSIVVKNIENKIFKKYEISYVGSMNRIVHPERFRLIDIITKSKLRQYIGTKSTSNMYSIYRESICVFNYSINNDLNMRVFEAIGNGSLLFTNKILGNGLEELFDEGVDYKLYSEDTFVYDLKDLTSQINLINQSSELRVNKIQKYHKYSNRIESLLEYTKSLQSKQYLKSNDFDIFDYMRIAYHNNSFKILLNILFNNLPPMNKTRNLLIRVIKEILK